MGLSSLFLGASANAAPFLGTKAQFSQSAFCRLHTCKLVERREAIDPAVSGRSLLIEVYSVREPGVTLQVGQYKGLNVRLEAFGRSSSGYEDVFLDFVNMTLDPNITYRSVAQCRSVRSGKALPAWDFNTPSYAFGCVQGGLHSAEALWVRVYK